MTLETLPGGKQDISPDAREALLIELWKACWQAETAGSIQNLAERADARLRARIRILKTVRALGAPPK